MGDVFSKNTKEETPKTADNNKNEGVNKEVKEVMYEEKVVETEMKRSALNISSNRIEIITKHPDSQLQDLHIVVVTDKNDRWMIANDALYRKTSDSEVWRYVELYSTGKYFERQLNLNERSKFTQILEEVVITLKTNGSKYITLLRDIVSNTDDIKLSNFDTCFDINKLV